MFFSGLDCAYVFWGGILYRWVVFFITFYQGVHDIYMTLLVTLTLITWLNYSTFKKNYTFWGIQCMWYNVCLHIYFLLFLKEVSGKFLDYRCHVVPPPHLKLLPLTCNSKEIKQLKMIISREIIMEKKIWRKWKNTCFFQISS